MVELQTASVTDSCRSLLRTMSNDFHSRIDVVRGCARQQPCQYSKLPAPLRLPSRCGQSACGSCVKLCSRADQRDGIVHVLRQGSEDWQTSVRNRPLTRVCRSSRA